MECRRFENKVVLVVASTSGIGRASAERFADEGASVIITGRREELGREVAEGIASRGGSADFIRLDASDSKSRSEAISAVIDRFGRIDVLHYNAGVTENRDDALGRVTEEVWDRLYGTNIKGAFFTFQEAYPALKVSRGCAVFTCSTAGLSATGRGTSIVYATTKAALAYLVKILARDSAADGVRVNGFAPGLTQTDILNGVDEATIDWLRSSIPLGFIGQPADQAAAAAFLCSDEARYITGQVFSVDGGSVV